MRNINTLMIAGILALATLEVQAQEAGEDSHWVSDELTTYVRSGPTDEYRIVGTLTAGDPVTVLETEGEYSRVEGPGGDSVWILSRELQEIQSANQRLPELEERVAELTTRLEGINEEWEGRVSANAEALERREQRIEELEARNQELEDYYGQARQSLRGLKARLDTQEQDLLVRYFMYGGGVAGAGLLVGLVVPHLPRRRKKRDRWF